MPDVPENEKLYQRLGLITRVWTPSAPIQSEELFAGRISQLEKVLDTIFEIGQHGVLFGERGVGKTSLANVIVTKFGERLTCLRVACDSEDRFETIWERVLSRIPVTFLQRKPGFGRQEEQLDFSLAGLKNDKGDKAAELADFLVSHQANGLVILDEFDRVSDPATKKKMADLIKNLSDQAAGLTVLIVGVADDITELTGEHPSVERCLRQIRLPRMSDGELQEIISNGARIAGVSFSAPAIQAIVTSSRGFPHYTHLLAKHAATVAAHARREKVGTQDFRAGVNAAIEDAQATIRDQYAQATASTKPSLYKDVLLAAALAPSDDYGTFRPKDLEPPLREITRRPLAVTTFFPHLAKLCTPDRACVLTKVGQRKRFRYRFTNPLMKPFVVLVGHRSGVDVDSILARTGKVATGSIGPEGSGLDFS